MFKVRQFPLVLAVSIMLLAAATLSPETAEAAPACPVGFTCSLEFDGDPSGSTPLVEPTDMKIGPGDIIYIATQDGIIRLVDPNQPAGDRLLPDPLIDISARVDSNAEHGLLGVEFHPDFDGVDGYFFVFYTVKGSNPSLDSFHRISRFELVSGSVDTAPYDPSTNPDGELILFETEAIEGELWHHGGMLSWGPDNKLYVGTGDSLFPGRAGELDSSFGKILRLNPDATMPTDNPFVAQASGKYEAIWAKGLRHPYNIAFSTVWDVMYINEVGQSSWEEINTGAPGADYGWNEDQNDGAQNDPAFVDPTHTYAHSGGCNAITGGIFYEPDVVSFPAEYYGQYFYTDYCSDWIDLYNPATDSAIRWSEGQTERLLRLSVDSEGNLWALKRLRNTGNQGTIVDQPASLYKFAFTAPFAPEMTVNPSDQAVVEGESATFTCAAAGNPTPAYQWQQSTDNGSTWADVPSGGSSGVYTTPVAALSDDGLQVRCTASNSEGNTTSAPATLTVVENELPQPVIDTPTASLTYSGDDTITFGGSATDAEDGTLPAANLEWTVNHHHAGVIKPVTNVVGQSSGSFMIEGDGGITTPNQFFRITLTATDTLGFSQSTSVDIQPNLIDVTLATDPTGLTINFEANPTTDGAVFSRVAGFDYALGAPIAQQSDGQYYVFESWQHGGDRNQSVTLPETDVTYTAIFSPDRDLDATYNASQHEVELAWLDETPNETGFTVQRKKAGATEWETLATLSASTEVYTDETVTCDQSYMYLVVATSTGGNLSAVLSPLVTTVCAPFDDVPSPTQPPSFELWIEDFYQAGITDGCNGGTPGVDLDYCPDRPVTRGAMAVFLLKAMAYPNAHTPTGDPGQIFADVPSPNQPPQWEDWIEDFYTLGITRGCNQGAKYVDFEYCPEDPVTRGAMAVFILRALEGENYTPPPSTGDVFVDIPSGQQPPFFADFIEELYDREITTGCRGTQEGVDLEFCPDDPVTRGAMAVFILRAFDDIPDPDDP